MIYNVEIKDKRSYDRLMVYLEGKGYMWISGKRPTKMDGREDAKKRHNSKLSNILIDTSNKKFGYIHGGQSDFPDDVETVTLTVLKDRLSETVDSDKAVPAHARTFRLLKDTVELRKGALVQEVSPNREYMVISRDFIKFPEDCKIYFRRDSFIRFSRMTVENQKNFFEEVYPTDVYLNEDELQNFVRWAKRSLKG